MGKITPWTREQEQELTRLFYLIVEGAYLSHRAMGAPLGKPRTAVIGKVHRMGLTRDPLVPCRGVDNKIAVQKKREQVPRTPVPPTYGRHFGASRGAKAPHIDNSPLVRSVTAIQITEATDKTCKFPIGHVGQEGFHLCGAVTERAPYCDEHHALCHLPLKDAKNYFAGAGRRW